MASPFPGMDPYLEDGEHWRSFHHYLADELVRFLNPLIVPKYFATVEVKTVLEELNISQISKIHPDTAILTSVPTPPQPVAASAVSTLDAPVRRVVTIPGQTRLRTVHIYVTETKKLVTSIEILSPANKYGEGLKKYRQKRHNLFRSMIHVVELDLLRGGQRPGWELQDPPLETDYVVLVNRATIGDSRISDIGPVGLHEPLPTIPIPLTAPDADVLLNLSAVFQTVYESFYYHLQIDYHKPVPPPALRPQMLSWLAQQLPHIGQAK